MSKSINYSEIGAKIRKQRERIGLTQEQLGEACGLSCSFIGHIERGSRKLSVESLCALASALDISADYLLFDHAPQETILPAEISSILRGCNQLKQQQFWRTVSILAYHIDEI